MATAAPAAGLRWQKLRAALLGALRAARVELVDAGAGGQPRGRGELVTHVAIAMHEYLSGRVPAEPADQGEGKGMKRSTKRLLIGAAAGLAVYHFVIAKR